MAGLKRPIQQAGPDVKKIARQLERGLTHGGQENVVKKASLKAKDIQVAELKRTTSTMRLRNAGRNGAKVGVMYRTKKIGYAGAESQISATGFAFSFIEGPNEPHTIIPKRRSGKQALTIPYKRGVFANAWHPGTPKAKTPWKTGYTKAKPHIKKIMRRETFTIVKDNYKL